MQQPAFKLATLSLLTCSFLCFAPLANASTELLDNIIVKQYANTAEQLKATTDVQRNTVINQSQQLWNEAPNLILGHENSGLGGEFSNQVWSLGFEFSLQSSEQKENYKSLAGTYDSLLPAQQNFLRWQASGKARGLIANYHQISLQVAGSEKISEQYQKLEKQLNVRVAMGETSQLELNQLKATMIEHQMNTQELQTSLNTINQQLKFWFGDNEFNNYVEESLAQNIDINQHPKLQWLTTQASLQQGQYDLLKGQIKPVNSYLIAAQHEHVDGVNDQKIILEMSMPMQENMNARLDSLDSLSALRQSQMEIQQIQAELLAQETVLKTEIAGIKTALVSAKNYLTVTQQNIELMNKSYELGDVSLLSLLNAQNQYINAQQKHVNLQAKLAEKIASYNQAVGVLLQ